MSYQPHLHKDNELYHWRPFGSKNGISNTPGYKAIGKIAKYIMRGGKKIYESAGRLWDGQAGRGTGQDASKRASRMAKQYQNEANFHERAGNVSGMVRARKDAARAKADIRKSQQAYDRSIVGRFNSAKKAVSGAAGNAGNWLRERASNISGYAKRAGSAISGAANRAGRAIGKAWDGKAGAGTGLDLRNERLTKSVTTRDKAQSAGYREAADAAKRDYDNSIVGRFNSAKRAVAGAAKSAGDWIGNRGRDVSRLAGRAGRAIGKAWDGKAGKGTGLDLRNERLTKSVTTRDKAQSAGYREAADVAKRDYDRSIVGTANRLLNRAGSAVRGAGEAISSGARRVGKAASDSYVRSGASNTAKTLMTKGPVQEVKNQLNASGGREAQQAKGNKTNVQSSKRSAQERKQYVDQVTRTWGGVQRRYDMLSDKVDNAKNENERMRAQEKLDKYTKETYIPARTTYNNVVKNKKK